MSVNSPGASFIRFGARDRAQPVADDGVIVMPRLEAPIFLDRDIAVRAVAEGKDPDATPVRDVMTPNIIYCYEDQDVSDAAHMMEQHQVRRLVVLNRDKRLVGIVSLGADLAVDTGDGVSWRQRHQADRRGRSRKA